MSTNRTPVFSIVEFPPSTRFDAASSPLNYRESMSILFSEHYTYALAHHFTASASLLGVCVRDQIDFFLSRRSHYSLHNSRVPNCTALSRTRSKSLWRWLTTEFNRLHARFGVEQNSVAQCLKPGSHEVRHILESKMADGGRYVKW